MPIWLELLVLSLIAYGVGIGIGWAIWGRNLQETGQDRGRKDEE